MKQHQHESGDTTRNLKLVFVLNLGFTLLEIVCGIWANSVAILADALHDLGESLSTGCCRGNWCCPRHHLRR